MDVRKLIVQLRATSSDRRVSRETGISRVTVRRYREWAHEHGLLDGSIPAMGELHRMLEETLPKLKAPQNRSSVEPYREQVATMRENKVEVAAILERLRERGFEGSYASVLRFVHASEEAKEPDAVVRVETAPGQEAQVDFGQVRPMVDPWSRQERKTWAFVMVLSWSRHAYVEFVFDQKVETWLLCHVHAFDYFGGVPERVTTDNLKAAIIRASWNEPEANLSYQECAEHYGFLIAPCRPRTPQHKGKVESGVHYVQRNFMGGREPTDILRANKEVREWCLGPAGIRIHGTTRQAPLERFEQTEREQLGALPTQPYDLGVYKKVTLHRDCHIIFDKSHYSAPFRLLEHELWARGGLRTVRIFNEQHELVATHDRAKEAGEWHTHPDHLPPHKLPGLLQTRESCLEQAGDVGPCTLEVVERLLNDAHLYRVPTAGRLVRLAGRYTAGRLEAACTRALHFEDPTYTTIKGILAEGLDAQPLPGVPLGEGTDIVSGLTNGAWNTNAHRNSSDTAQQFTYARDAREILGHLFGHDEFGEAAAQPREGGPTCR